ncbi:MAG: enoyl-CoA hydratase/isomerase family protein [Deltaproteobacteria bacterium]|nr:enoyl-CoA hydratase/isomerase family protein [Deltaproteobacteria bacterium]
MDKEEGVATISLNRPERYNALNRDILLELNKALDDVSGDETINAVIITGKGKAFCAGGDIQGHPAFETQDDLELDALISEAQAVIPKIHRMEKVVIAAINGIAGGAGLDMALACDLRIASETATFAEFYIKAGMMSDFGGSYFLTKYMSLGKALEMLLTGDIIDAEEALHLGLVNHVVPHHKVLDKALSLARRFANGPIAAQRLMKKTFYASLNTDLETALEMERRGQNILIGTQDCREAIQAFKEKRNPVFKGK